MSTEQKTPRMLIRDLYAAQDRLSQEKIREQLQGHAPTDQPTASGSDPDESSSPIAEQAMPEPLVFDLLSEEQESIGHRPLSEISDLLHGGLALSLVVGHQEYSIEWRDGAFLFEVWEVWLEGSTRLFQEAYPSLSALLQVEGSRPSFDLRAFAVIG